MTYKVKICCKAKSLDTNKLAHNPRQLSKMFGTRFGKNFGELYLCTIKSKNDCFWNILTDGVTGNTSDFGSEESRFEP